MIKSKLLLLTSVSLLSFGTTQQAHAVCAPGETAGDDVITCTGANGAQLFNDGGGDTITIDPGASLSRSGNGSVLRLQNNTDIDLINNGNIEITGGNARFQDVVLIQRATGDINIVNTGTILNNSTNNNSISAAIQVARDSNFNTFTLDNSGTISSTRQAIHFGSLSRGAQANANYDSSTITNQIGGIIQATGSVQEAIFYNAGDDTLINEGMIIGNVTFGAGDDTFNIDLDTGSFVGDADGGTHNAGDTLSIDSDSADATVNNNFSNFEDLNLSGDNDFTVVGESSFNNISLLGTTDLIVGSGGELTATVGLTGTSGNNITVDNGGTLNANTTLTNADETFTINGDVTGDINLGDGDDVLSINFDTGNYAGIADGGANTAGDDLNFISAQNQNVNLDNFVNFEDLSLNGNGIFTTQDGSTGTFDTISLINNTNLIVGNNSTLTSAGAFANGGANNITIMSDGVINADSFAAPSTLTFDVATDTSFGVLNVTGGAVDLTGTTVTALISDAVTDGDELPVAIGTAPLIGIGGGAGQAFTDIDDTSLLFNFGIADGAQPEVTTSGDANTLFIVSDKVFLIREVIRGGNEQNVGDVLEVLEAIPAGINNPEIQAVLGQVNSASNAEELTTILQAALPVLDTSAFSAAQSVTGNTLRLVSDRLTVIRDHGESETGVSSGDVTENLQMWGQVFGQNIQQGVRKEIAGFDARTRGATVGFDTEVLGDSTTAGVAFSYASTDVDSRGVNNTESDIKSYNVSLYGDYDLTESSYLVGDLGYTYGDNETTRFNVGGITGLNANSDYGSHQLEARVIAAKDYEVNQIKGVRITPKIQAHYIHYKAEDISETGAGGAGLNVDNDSLNVLEFGVGVDLRKDHNLYNGGVLSPEVNLGYRYDVVGDTLQTTSTFAAGGPSFTSEGAEPDQSTWNAGLGIGYTAPNNVEFTVSYDYEHKDEYNSHSALLRLAAPF